jgi:hypothetical protein
MLGAMVARLAIAFAALIEHPLDPHAERAWPYERDFDEHELGTFHREVM